MSDTEEPNEQVPQASKPSEHDCEAGKGSPPPLYRDELGIEKDKRSRSNSPEKSPSLTEPSPPSYYPPTRYLKRDTEESQSEDRETARTERRTRARETRKIRRTLKLKQHEEIHTRVEISSESDASTIDENYEVASLKEDVEDHLTWRGRMQEALHNHWLHVFIVILVSLDALIVIFELLLDVGAFNNRLCMGENPFERARFCHYLSPSMCSPHASMILASTNISASPGVGKENLCFCGFQGGLYICLEAGAFSEVNPAVVLHICSLVILTVFMVEIAVKMIAFRLKYFTHKFEVFDGIIVVISWTLDVASIIQEEAFEAASLLIILRLWRVVRIVNGAILSSKTQSDNKLKHAKSEARNIIHALHKAQDKMDEFEEENVKLRGQLAKSRSSAGNGKSKHFRRDSSESDTSL